MTEALFVLTIIYVAYVFYTICNDKKTQVKSTPPPIAEPEKQAVVADNLSPTPAPTQEPPIIVKADLKTTESSNSKKSVVNKQSTPKKGLKDPKTGEIATTYNNYRFTKRWIKEALVTEGLLEKVYKNNELNADCETNIKVAIAKLEAMEKYKV